LPYGVEVATGCTLGHRFQIVRANCQRCGEEIINEREVVAHGQTLRQRPTRSFPHHGKNREAAYQ